MSGLHRRSAYEELTCKPRRITAYVGLIAQTVEVHWRWVGQADDGLLGRAYC